jgi:hypothetical protein
MVNPDQEGFVAQRAGAQMIEVDSSHAVMLVAATAVTELVRAATRRWRAEEPPVRQPEDECRTFAIVVVRNARRPSLVRPGLGRVRALAANALRARQVL